MRAIVLENKRLRKIIPYRIRKPIWNNRKIGIADFRLRLPRKYFYLEILYKDRSGNRVYPGIYRIETLKARRYPTQKVKNTTLHIIPIEDLTPIEPIEVK